MKTQIQPTQILGTLTLALAATLAATSCSSTPKGPGPALTVTVMVMEPEWQPESVRCNFEASGAAFAGQLRKEGFALKFRTTPAGKQGVEAGKISWEDVQDSRDFEEDKKAPRMPAVAPLIGVVLKWRLGEAGGGAPFASGSVITATDGTWNVPLKSHAQDLKDGIAGSEKRLTFQYRVPDMKGDFIEIPGILVNADELNRSL